jgi:hypothetical protein
MPGAFGDAFRAIEALPGVTPIASGLPYFFIRGAPPGNTGYFIDGVRVPGLFHLGVGPAVLYPALLERVDLYKGAYPVSFGRFAGGVLAAETVGNSERARADWTFRLFDAGALVEVPFGQRKPEEAPRGAVLVSGRYGYPGLLLSIFAPNDGLAYWDYQSRANYRLTDRDTVSVFAFGSYDSVLHREKTQGRLNDELTELINIQFHRIDLRWDRQFSETTRARTAVTVGFDRTASGQFAAASHVLGARTSAETRLNDRALLRAGADAWFQSYDFGAPNGARGSDDFVPGVSQPSSSLSGVQTDVSAAAWIDAPLQLGTRVAITPGLRADYFTSQSMGETIKVPALDPRITSRVALGPVFHLGAIGLAHQPAALPLSAPALTFTQLRRGLQSGYHLSQGLEVPLPASLTATVTGFLHAYKGLVDLAQPCAPTDETCDDRTVRGRSIGLEFMLRRTLLSRVSGLLAYTLSRSTRESLDVTTQRITTRLSEFDRTHVLTGVLSVDLGSGWRSGVRYAAYSGVPYSTVNELLLPNARTPAFQRIDLRVEKRWTYEHGRSLTFTMEMFNALLMKESLGVSCVGRPPSCRPDEIGPIAIPSLGLEGTL